MCLPILFLVRGQIIGVGVGLTVIFLGHFEAGRYLEPINTGDSEWVTD